MEDTAVARPYVDKPTHVGPMTHCPYTPWSSIRKEKCIPF